MRVQSYKKELKPDKEPHKKIITEGFLRDCDGNKLATCRWQFSNVS